MKKSLFFLSTLIFCSSVNAANISVIMEPEKHQVGQQFTLSAVFPKVKCSELKSVEVVLPKTVVVIGKTFRDILETSSCKYNWVLLEQSAYTGYPKINFEWVSGKKDSWSFAEAEVPEVSIPQEQKNLATVDPDKKKHWSDFAKVMPYLFFPKHESIKVPSNILKLKDCRIPLDQVAACLKVGNSQKSGCPIENLVSYRGECDLQSLDISEIKSTNLKDYSYQVQNVKNISKVLFKMKFQAKQEADRWDISYQLMDGMLFDELGSPVLEFNASYAYESKNNGASFLNKGGSSNFPDPYGKKSTTNSYLLPLDSK